jgi:hypothetical protein
MKRLMLLVTAQFFMAAAVQAAEISIDSPRGGFTTARVQEISGTVTGFSGTRADLIINGIPQSIPLTNGSFKLNTVVAPGTNLVEVRAEMPSNGCLFRQCTLPRCEGGAHLGYADRCRFVGYRPQRGKMLLCQPFNQTGR